MIQPCERCGFEGYIGQDRGFEWQATPSHTCFLNRGNLKKFPKISSVDGRLKPYEGTYVRGDLIDFGEYMQVPGLNTRNKRLPKGLVIHLLNQIGRFDFEAIERRLWHKLYSPNTTDLTYKLKSRQEYEFCVVCQAPANLSGKWAHPVCADCEEICLEIIKHEDARQVLVYLFSKKFVPPHAVAGIFLAVFDCEISSYIGKYLKALNLFVVASDWVFELFEKWGMMMPPIPLDWNEQIDRKQLTA